MSSVILRHEFGDLEVSALVLRAFERGNWVATTTIGWPEAPAVGGAASLRFARQDGSEDVWTGSIRRATLIAESETLSVTIVGGAGLLLAPEIPPRFHTTGAAQIPAGLVLAGIADATGETLADGAETELDGYPLASWMRLGGTGRDAIDTLAGVLGLGWRVLASGELWMGEETWPELDSETLARCYFERGDPADGMVLYAVDATPVFAGKSVNGVRPVEVCYHYDAMIADRSKGALRMELRTALPGDPTYAPNLARYARPYPGTVRAQAADGTLAIACDDPSVGDGLQSIPLRVGLPGCAVTVPEGTRVRVRFENADPRGCYAGGDIDQDPAASKALALKDDKSVCGSLSGAADLGTGAVTFTYTGPFGSQTGLSVDLEGKIDSPCHAYAKGVPAS